MATDVFPKTLRTWIGGELERGDDGRESVNHYIMDTYAWPLKVYYLGTRSRWLGEPEEVIAGFFASRLARQGYLHDWQQSGKRLRHWLINGFSYYLMELRRERRKESQTQSSSSFEDEAAPSSGDPEMAVERAAAIAFVRQAMEETRELCQRKNLETHWQIFLRHNLDGQGFPAIAEAFDVTPARATVMSRTATRQFRAALRDVLFRDGVADEDVDHEIRALLEHMGS